MKIRPATINDAENIYNLIEDTNKEAECLGSRTKEYIINGIGDYLVVEIGKELIGLGQLVVIKLDNTSEIRSLCIAKKYQGQGIGTKLLRTLMTAATTKNILVETTPPNRRLFEKFGFKFLGTLKDIYLSKTPADLYEEIKDYPKECARCPDNCPGIMLLYSKPPMTDLFAPSYFSPS